MFDFLGATASLGVNLRDIGGPHFRHSVLLVASLNPTKGTPKHLPKHPPKVTLEVTLVEFPILVPWANMLSGATHC